MSSYRDDHNAARLRIETLEAKLLEREAALMAREAELAERDAEIARLKRGAGPGGPSDVSEAMGAAPRKALAAIMGIGLSVLFLTGFGGYLRMGHHRSRCGFDRQRWHGPPPSPMVMADPAAVMRREPPPRPQGEAGRRDRPPLPSSKPSATVDWGLEAQKMNPRGVEGTVVKKAGD